MVASEYTVGWSLVDEVRDFLSKMKPDVLAKHLVGGLTIGEMEQAGFDLARYSQVSLGAAAVDDPGFFVLPPVPNSLFQRDPSCWIYQWRHGQPDVLAGPSPGSAQHADDLPLPPHVPGRRLRVLVSTAG